jgi:hypothetical protein
MQPLRVTRSHTFFGHPSGQLNRLDWIRCLFRNKGPTESPLIRRERTRRPQVMYRSQRNLFFFVVMSARPTAEQAVEHLRKNMYSVMLCHCVYHRAANYIGGPPVSAKLRL